MPSDRYFPTRVSERVSRRVHALTQARTHPYTRTHNQYRSRGFDTDSSSHKGKFRNIKKKLSRYCVSSERRESFHPVEPRRTFERLRRRRGRRRKGENFHCLVEFSTPNRPTAEKFGSDPEPKTAQFAFFLCVV